MPLNLGIIGCGNIVAMHLRHIDQTPVRVAAVMDVAGARAEALGKRLGCAWTTSREELLSRADVQAVLVATPNTDHAESALAALAAGKHVLCEKPIVLTMAAAAEVVRAAASAKTIFQSAFMRRCHDGYLQLRELVRDRIGEIQHVRVRNTDAISGDQFVKAQTSEKWLASTGGFLALSGCHALDVMRWVLGEPEKVYAKTRSWTQVPMDTFSSAVFDYGSFTAFFEYGLHRVRYTGHLGVSWEDSWEVIGEKARVTLSMPHWERYEQDRPTLRIQWEDGRVEEPFVPACDYYQRQLVKFEANIRQNRADPDARDGARAQALVVAMQESSRRGAAVDVPEFYQQAGAC